MLIELRIKVLHVKLRALITEAGYAIAFSASAFAHAVTTWAQQLQDAALCLSDDYWLREIEERAALNKLIDAEVNEQFQRAKDRETAAWAAHKRASDAAIAAEQETILVRHSIVTGTAARDLHKKLGI